MPRRQPLLPALVGPVEHQTEDQHGPADHGDRAQGIAIARQVQREAEKDDGDGADDQPKRQPRLAAVGVARGKPAKPGQRHPHIRAEIQHHRAERADMHGHVDHLPLILHSGQLGQQNQVARRGNRQEFGDPLDDRDKKKVKQAHVGLSWLDRFMSA